MTQIILDWEVQYCEDGDLSLNNRYLMQSYSKLQKVILLPLQADSVMSQKSSENNKNFWKTQNQKWVGLSSHIAKHNGVDDFGVEINI